MGLLITRDTFDDRDVACFGERLRRGLGALRELFERPGFGEGETTIGAELELFLVDPVGRPLPHNREVLAQTVDTRFTVEIDRFNLEFNALPRPLAGAPFSAMREELDGALVDVDRAARAQGGRIVPIGILPTIRREDLVDATMTDLPRYRALAKSIRARRGGPFHLRIDGEDPLAFDFDDVAVEGAGTSFQLHLRVPPKDFCRFYNAAQIATIPALAASGNSPILCGHRLWEETRIALFKQAVDDRQDHAFTWHPASRVSFGHGWAREGAYELFAESVALHAPLLPVCGPEDPLEALARGKTPELAELRLHHGTVWHWNRPVYDPAGGGHVRIELRALPAGPTVVDMVANAAFLLGATIGLAEDVDDLLPAYPFSTAQYAFYRAAQRGLSAVLPFPSGDAPSPQEILAADLCERLLPVARRGLEAAFVDAAEADFWLSVFARRVASRRTGARFQRAVLDSLLPKMPLEEAARVLLERYEANAATGAPVADWSLGV